MESLNNYLELLKDFTELKNKYFAELEKNRKIENENETLKSKISELELDIENKELQVEDLENENETLKSNFEDFTCEHTFIRRY